MEKSEEKLKNMLVFVENNPGLSSTQIAKSLSISPPTAWKYLGILVKSGKVELKGNRKSSRYFPKSEESALTPNILQRAIEIVSDSFEIEGGFSPQQIEADLKESFAYIHPSGHISYGIIGFISWCHDPKRAYTDIGRQLGLYLGHYFDEEHKRRKHGFFDGTASLQANLLGQMKIGIDTLLFMESAEISGFGRTRIALELYYGKQNSDRFLLSQAISRIAPKMREYILKNTVDAVIFVPPTIPRFHQFRDVLRESLTLNIREIPASKVSRPDGTLQAQKNLKGSDRIINALATVSVDVTKYRLSEMRHIVILDDNFTTGATMNAIALKLRDAGYGGKVTAMTVTGKFFYDPNTVDATEI